MNNMENIENEDWVEFKDNIWVSSLGYVIRIKKNGNPHIYPLNDNGHKYLRITIDREGFYVHRLVAECFLTNTDPEKFKLIDHINCDARDNRACNLRYVDHIINGQNRFKKETASSKYLGVRFDKKREKYIVNSTINKIHVYLGLYEDEKEAAKAYDKKVLELMGGHGITNFPKSDYQELEEDKKPDKKKYDQKKYYDKFKDKNKDEIKKSYVCACGGEYTYFNKSRHNTTRKHKEWLNKSK